MQIFTTQREDINGRLDCYYYQPEFVELEKKIRGKTDKTLGDFVLGIAGGATPNKLYSDKYYAKSADDGIPFLRVQNITNEGLNFENLKFIKKETHQGLLKRSQVKANYLITKITGVGRMAISSVVPKNFEGNINQHLVAIKTKSYEISEALATFLNSDIGERLASRRSTGGTRPALDYKALLNIPVMLNLKIVSIMQSAYKKREEKLKQADKLLNSIDDYVLNELGVKLPEMKDKMCFVVNSEEIKTGRIDPNKFLAPQDTPRSTKFKEKKLNEVASLTKGQSITNNNIVFGDYPVVAGGQTSPYTINKFNHKGDVITISASGAYSGYVWHHDEPIFASDCTVIKSLDKNTHSTFYLYCVMKAKQKFIYNMQQGAGQPHVYSRDLSNLKIPIPPPQIQNKITKEVKLRTQKAQELQKEAREELQKAKKKVEEMILN